ncbi:hypothetical protein [Sphingobacterium olei]|nr:hypothetical protein [Sphingobacterium olei]
MKNKKGSSQPHPNYTQSKVMKTCVSLRSKNPYSLLSIGTTRP